MAYSDPQSTHNPTTGQIIPASWGDIIRDDLEYLARNKPHCSIKESTAKPIANNTWTAHTSDEENYDVGGMHSTVTNTSRITVPAGEAGKYRVSCAVDIAAAAGGERYLGIGKNGAAPSITVASFLGSASITAVMNGGAVFALAAGDYLECYVYQNSGGAVNSTLKEFAVEWIAI